MTAVESYARDLARLVPPAQNRGVIYKSSTTAFSAYHRLRSQRLYADGSVFALTELSGVISLMSTSELSIRQST